MTPAGKEIVAAVALGTAATFALFYLYISLPLLGFVAGVAAPAPACFYYLKFRRLPGIVIVLVAAVAVSAFDRAAGILYLMQGGIVSLLMGELLLRGRSGLAAVSATVAATTTATAVAALVFAASAGHSLREIVTVTIRSGVTETIAAYRKAGRGGEELEILEQVLRQGGELMERLFPSLTVLALAGIAATTLYIISRKREKLPVDLNIGRFHDFRNPDHLVWGLIVCGFSLLVPDQNVAFAALNVLVIVLALYLVQGLAITSWFFRRMPAGNLFRTMFYLFLVLQPYLAVPVILIGLFDLWLNIRTRQRENL